MKRIIVLCVVFTMCCAAYAQDDVYYQPQRNYETKILIKTDKPKAENIKYCVDVLTRNDISCSVDKETHIVKTDVLNSQKRRYPYYLNFFCKDSVIVVSGKFKTGLTVEMWGVRAEDNFETIQNKGMKGSAYKVVFSEMQSVAGLFNFPTSAN